MVKYFIWAGFKRLLKSIQSSDMDSIEIITQPSSKYDAAGNAGIVNIKLKRQAFGTNGSVALGYGLEIVNMIAHFLPNHRQRDNIFCSTTVF
jgi:hypothetical protein